MLRYFGTDDAPVVISGLTPPQGPPKGCVTTDICISGENFPEAYVARVPSAASVSKEESTAPGAALCVCVSV